MLLAAFADSASTYLVNLVLLVGFKQAFDALQGVHHQLPNSGGLF